MSTLNKEAERIIKQMTLDAKGDDLLNKAKKLIRKSNKATQEAEEVIGELHLLARQLRVKTDNIGIILDRLNRSYIALTSTLSEETVENLEDVIAATQREFQELYDAHSEAEETLKGEKGETAKKLEQEIKEAVEMFGNNVDDIIV